MISALELGTGLKSTAHPTYGNQFYFNVGGKVLWVGCYAEYEVTADGKGKSGTRIPCSLVEAIAYVKSGGAVVPSRGVVSGSLYKKSEGQRELLAELGKVSILDQVEALLAKQPEAPKVQAEPVAMIDATVDEDAEIAKLKAAIAAKKAAKASKAAEIAALKAELAALED
jgi:hypothetical protein